MHYVRAAAKSVHPTFVQEMLGDAAYSCIRSDPQLTTPRA